LNCGCGSGSGTASFFNLLMRNIEMRWIHTTILGNGLTTISVKKKTINAHQSKQDYGASHQMGKNPLVLCHSPSVEDCKAGEEEVSSN
jgi:hypothetical protein